MLRFLTRGQGTAAAGALWNLAAHEENKLPIAQSGVIPSLIKLLSSSSVDCKLNACGALQNLCVHPSNKVEVATCGGIQVMACCMPGRRVVHVT